MHLRRYRRPFALLSAMLFILSIVGHGIMLGDMNAKMMAAANAEMATQDGAMNCDKSVAGCDDMKGMHLTCFAQCASLVAILSESAPLQVFATAHEMYSVAMNELESRIRPPDPYPPKPLVLI